MRCLALALLFATVLAAQRGGGGRFGGGFRGPVGVRSPVGVGRGFIGGHHRGSFGGFGVRGPVSGGYRPGFNVRVGPTYHRPVYRSYGYGGGYGGIWGWGGGFYPPFGWYSAPLWGSTAGYGYGYPSSPAPNVTIIMVPPAQTPEPVYSAPSVAPPPVSRSAPVEERAVERPLVSESWAYVIALRNGTAWLARNYSVVDGMVQLTTITGEQKELRMPEVDLATTEQLNRERGVAVRLR